MSVELCCNCAFYSWRRHSTGSKYFTWGLYGYLWKICTLFKQIVHFSGHASISWQSLTPYEIVSSCHHTHTHTKYRTKQIPVSSQDLGHPKHLIGSMTAEATLDMRTYECTHTHTRTHTRAIELVAWVSACGGNKAQVKREQRAQSRMWRHSMQISEDI